VISELRRLNKDEPTISQLKNYLFYKKTLETPKTHNIGELAALCENYANPASEDEPFVVDKMLISNPDGSPTIRIFVSTQRLLGQCANADAIHADATYKLLWEGKNIFKDENIKENYLITNCKVGL